MSQAPVRVLFVSTGGACRSIFAEALLRHVGGPRYEVWSCGTDPAPVDPPAAMNCRGILILAFPAILYASIVRMYYADLTTDSYLLYI